MTSLPSSNGPGPAPGEAGNGRLHLWPTADLLRERAPLLAPLLLVGILTVTSAAAMVPLVRTAYADRPELTTTVFFGMGLLAALAPLTTLLKCAVLGSAAWAILVLVGAEVRYRTAVSLLAHAQIVLVAQAAWVVALLWIRGPGRIATPEDLALTTGLDAFVADRGSPLAVLAHAVDPFQLLWVVVVALGLTAVARTTRLRGAVAAVAVWALAVAVPVVRAWL